ncbi:uncharacterized protein [Haliotis asinina]|uniref:uncharacterized protein n=1 Tax=Haliotis asinina TaxID=109174 RepID=UPI003531B36C
MHVTANGTLYNNQSSTGDEPAREQRRPGRKSAVRDTVLGDVSLCVATVCCRCVLSLLVASEKRLHTEGGEECTTAQMTTGRKTEDVLRPGSLQSTLLVVMVIQTSSSTPYLICPEITTSNSTANLTCTREGNMTTNFTEAIKGAQATVCHLHNGTCTTRDDRISAYVVNTTTSAVTAHTLALGDCWVCVKAPDPCNIPVGEPPDDHTTAIIVGIIVGVVMVTAILVFCRIKRAIRAYNQTPKSFESTGTSQTLDP